MTPGAVLFDCDGVLADSEGPVNRMVAADLSARGWALDMAGARAHFLGLSLPEMMAVIEARIGPLPMNWAQDLSARIAAEMTAGVVPIPGVLAALARVAARLPVAVASNAGRLELRAKLGGLGIEAVFGGRVFSYQDVARPKPFPDIYLAAAAACGVAASRCVVVEDSVTGVRAGVAAGCRVLGFAHEEDPARLAAHGAEPFRDMAELPGLLGLVAA